MTKRLLISGASGLLGLNLGLLACEHLEVTGITNRHALRGVPFRLLHADLAQPGAFARAVEDTRPDWVIHTAAQANVDACEKDPPLSRRLNGELPGEVAEACARHSIPLAHISTDAVFDGLRGGYSETDAPNPQGIYAQDKLAGERAVAAAFPGALIARVTFYGWSLSGQRSLGEFFVHNLAESRPVNGFTDVFFCPLLVDQLAETLLEMLAHGLSGVFHVLSHEHLSKYQFGVQIARIFGFDENLITPISVTQGGLAARRSPNLTLRVDKLEAALGHAMPGQVEMLERFHQQYLAGHPALIRGYSAES